MKKFFSAAKNKFINLSITRRILTVIFAVLVFMTFWSFIRMLVFAYWYAPFPPKNHGQNMNATDVINNIQPWMSFDYLNQTFNLPPDYLRETLHITDGRYPRLGIGGYAKHIKIDKQHFFKTIEEAIRNYQNKSQ